MSNPNNNNHRDHKYVKLCAYGMCTIVPIFCGILFLIMGSKIYYKPCDTIVSIEQSTQINESTFCAEYNQCFWTCCTNNTNNYICPSDNNILGIINTSASANFDCQLNNIECGSTLSKQCCPGGPCVKTLNYWTVQCTYTLSGPDNDTINVTAHADYLFRSKKIATNSFLCRNNNSLKLNGQVYVPIDGYDVSLQFSSNMSWCPYITENCFDVFKTIFDNPETFSGVDQEYYNNYLNSRSKSIAAGIIFIIGGLITLILWCKVNDFGCFSYFKHRRFTRISVPKITNDVDDL